MGEVYRAFDTTLERQVAVKVLPEDLSSDPDRLARLKREAKLLASISHPNIATIHSLEEADGVRFLVLELVGGETLAERLARGRIGRDEALAIARQIAEALQAAHGSGIIHRDLKPANVKVTPDGTVKVLDFGLAKPTEGREPGAEELSHSPTVTVAGTRAGVLLGTAPYMSPEQVRGEPADKRADIWAFGCVLYEMLSGKPPFAGRTVSDTLAAILRAEPDGDALPDDTPDAVRSLLRRCLQKDTDRRLHDIADARIEVEEVSERESGQSRKRGRTLRWAGVAATLVIVLAVGWLGWTGWFAGLGEPSLDPELLVVLPFENRTGDSSLDDLGLRAASDIAEGITETDSVRVASLVDDLSEPAETAAREGLPSQLAPAREAGAATAVAGEYYLSDGIIEVRTRLLDVAAEEIIFAAEPARAATSDQAELIESLRQRVMGMVALHFGIQRANPITDYIQRTLGPPDQWSKIPDYDAYVEYLSGIEIFLTDAVQALGHFQRAIELDPEFFPPWFFAHSIHRGMGNWEAIESILRELEPRLSHLSPFERVLMAYARAMLEGDVIEARRQVSLAHEMVPSMEQTTATIASLSLALNEPARVVAALTASDRRAIEEMGLSPGASVCITLTKAYHLLGEYDEELQEARRALSYYPSFLTLREAEVRALAALGRTEGVRGVIDESMAVRSQAGTPDRVMLAAVEELRVHGSSEAAREIAESTVAWVSNLPSADQSPVRLARALFAADRWEEARAIVEEVAEHDPDSIELQGYLGVIAARLGDEGGARRISEELRALDRPFVFGRHTYWQAAIHAILADRDRAVQLIREWISQAGGIDYVALHRDPNLSSLWGYPPFQEILRPKG
jgi:tetratricopeptide (TPR) repeat protein